MALIYSDNKHYTDIADALREKLGTQGTYLPSEMAQAVSEIEAGGDTLRDLLDITGNAQEMFIFFDDVSFLQYDTTRNVKNFGGSFWHSTITEIPHINTAKGTDFNAMFGGCNGLGTASIGIANEFSLAQAENLGGMFADCENLVTLYVTNIPSSCTVLSNLVDTCELLTTIVISGDTSNVESTSTMFRNCFALESAPLFDTSSVLDMSGMFYNCNITSVPAYDCTNVTTFENMLKSCAELRSVGLLNIGASLDISASNHFNSEALATIITNLKTIPQEDPIPVLTMKSASYALLTPEYIAMAAQKNWTINTL